MLLVLSLMTIVSGCGKQLPAGFPEPPAIELCIPLYGNGKLTNWHCENSATRERLTRPSNYVHIGVPNQSWEEIRNYEADVRLWAADHCEVRR